jgi:hypothetical protein
MFITGAGYSAGNGGDIVFKLWSDNGGVPGSTLLCTSSTVTDPLVNTVRLTGTDDLGGPNGILVQGDDVWVVTFGSGELYKLGKALAAASRVAQAFGFARGKNFDYGLAHGSTDLPPVGRVLGIPNTTMFDYEWARLQHEVNCRLATRVLVPDAIPADRLAVYGMNGRLLTGTGPVAADGPVRAGPASTHRPCPGRPAGSGSGTACPG